MIILSVDMSVLVCASYRQVCILYRRNKFDIFLYLYFFPFHLPYPTFTYFPSRLLPVDVGCILLAVQDVLFV